MSEISMYEAQKKKLQGLCDEHDLVFRFIKDRYPITLTIKPVQGMDAQISMLENVEEVGYRSPDASMTWIFEDGVLETKVTGGTFTISKTLRGKIENVLVKMIAYWQQYFFRDVMEKNALRPGVMPVIDEDEADDSEAPPMLEGAEPLEEYEDDGEIPGDEELDEDDPDIQEATRIVRGENKASTALLQRRMNIGYAKAAASWTLWSSWAWSAPTTAPTRERYSPAISPMTMTARRARAMMRREDYKAVKRMDKTQMEKYLQTVYQRGFDAGVKSVIAKTKAAIQAKAAGSAPEAEG